MNLAIVIAGGIGSRMGANIPKQFIEVNGKHVLAYTIESFEKHPLIDAIEVVCIKGWEKDVWSYKEKYNFKKLKSRKSIKELIEAGYVTLELLDYK